MIALRRGQQIVPAFEAAAMSLHAGLAAYDTPRPSSCTSTYRSTVYLYTTLITCLAFFALGALVMFIVVKFFEGLSRTFPGL